MKKQLLSLLIFPLLLSGCSLINNVISPTDTDSGTDTNTETQAGSETDSGTEVSSEILPISNYGDYVSSTSNLDVATLTERYNALNETVTSEKNGIFQSSYKQGLLDFFDINKKVVVKVNISDEELNKIDADYYANNKESYRICSVDITISDLVFHYEEVGIRLKGNTSRRELLNGDNINLRHFKLSFEETFDDEFTNTPKVWEDLDAKAYREDRDFFGLSKINLRWNRNNDSTYIREYYAFEMYRGNGNLSARTNPINLKMKVNDKTYNMGVYLAVEEINKSFIKRNLVKASRGGDLYKLSWGSGQGAKFNVVDDYFFGVERQYKNDNRFEQETYTYELKTNKDTSDHSIIKNFISNLDSQHGDTIKDFMVTNSIYDRFVSYLAISYLLGDPDDLRGNYNNTYVYFTADTNQIIFIPTDNDRVLGATGGVGGNPTGSHAALTAPLDKRTGYGGENDSKLFNVCLFSSNSEEIPEDYMNAIQDVIDNDWMDFDKYNGLYEIAKNHYQNDTTLSEGIIGSSVNFDIFEDSDVHSDNNLSVNIYLENKVSTYDFWC